MSKLSVLERAAQWFLESGIQEPAGGVARYYRSDIQKNARVSTEITGYAVSFLVYAHERCGNPEFLGAALRAARFLAQHARDAGSGLFPFEHSSNGSQPDPLAYFFDSGIIVRGLLRASGASGEPNFREAAVATGRGMLEHFRSGSEMIDPILTLPGKQALPYEPRWSASPGCYQLKSAMAWHDLYEATADPEFRNAYEAALHWTLTTYQAFLPGDADPEKVMDRLHAFLYFLEGMLPCAGRSDCRMALESGLDRVARYLADIAPVFVRSDVYAQLLRIRLFAANLGIIPLDEIAATEEAAAAAAFEFESEEPRLKGGFVFGAKRGEWMPFVNPVSTAFCAQAIDMLQRYQAGSLQPDRLALI